ncbi:MAG: helix-turn-helix transcriptional regulator [Isosphaeraceae bacterium]|nr:helix-turn-helix transcriptional regulator [Isosphaeraceae bacterium]
MGKSQRLRHEDIRAAFRLVGDCRDVGYDLRAWMTVAMLGLHRATHAMMSCTGYAPAADSAYDAEPGDNLISTGWASESDKDLWAGFIAEGRHRDYPTFQRIFQEPGPLTVKRRRDLVSDRVWLRCTELNEDRRSVGQDDMLLGVYRTPVDRGHISFSVNRAWGDRPFEDRDRRFVRLVCEELFALPETSLVRDVRGPLARLSPRLRDVLLALVEGDGEKQAALRLGISRHTVHDLVKELYRRFDVSSRGELLAAYYRRRLRDRPSPPAGESPR